MLEITGAGQVRSVAAAGYVGETERVLTEFMLMPTLSGSAPLGAGENLSLYVNASSNLLNFRRR